MAVNSYVLVFHDGSSGELAYEWRERGATIKRMYRSIFVGFAAELDDALYAETVADPRVKRVELEEQEIVVEPLALTTDTLTAFTSLGRDIGQPWHLDRVGRSTGQLGGEYTYRYDGTGVRLYIIDTGTNAHTEWAGRLVKGWAHPDNPEADPTYALFNHGSQTCGPAAGTTTGFAKGATVVAVQYGYLEVPTEAEWLDMLDWVLTDYNTAAVPAVANMSFGQTGGVTQNIEDAWVALWDAGMVLVCAGGNDNETSDQTNGGTDRLPQKLQTLGKIITVGATSGRGALKFDGTKPTGDGSFRAYRPDGSTDPDRVDFLHGAWDTPDRNYSAEGAWIDIWAPSNVVTVDGSQQDTGTVTTYDRSGWGTSFASPCVAGVVACLLEEFPTATPAEIRTTLLARASATMVGLEAGENNRHLTSCQNLWDESTLVTTTVEAATSYTDTTTARGNHYRYRIRRTGGGLIHSDWSETELWDDRP